MQLWKFEDQLGTYTLFNRREELRRFVMSAYVLVPFNQIFNERGRAAIQQDDTLAYIHYQEEGMKSDKDPIDKFPFQSDSIHLFQRPALACA